MMNKELLVDYIKIISEYDTNPNYTLVDFSLDGNKRDIINLVNEEAKKDKELANLLKDLKYSNNKTKDIEEYFNKKSKNNNNYQNTRFCGRILSNDYGFVNLTSLIAITGSIALVLSLVIAVSR